jgi:hypothetical protein
MSVGCTRVGVALHSFLISGLDGGDCSTSIPGRLKPAHIEFEAGWALEVGQDVFKNREVFYSLPEFELRIAHPVA